LNLARVWLDHICANLIDFLYRRRRSENDFIRKRSLPFPTLIVFIMICSLISSLMTCYPSGPANRIREKKDQNAKAAICPINNWLMSMTLAL
jgi:hypothetical protein